MLGTAPLYLPWRWAGFGPHTAYQLWMLCCWTLNFTAFFFLLVRGFRVSSLAASSGAALFAFGSPRMANIMHQQLVVQFFLVLSLWAAIAVYQNRDRNRELMPYSTRRCTGLRPSLTSGNALPTMTLIA